MKKVITWILALVLTFSLAGCSTNSASDLTNAQPVTETVENKEITISIQSFEKNGIDATPMEQTGTFSGTLVDGVPSGDGTFKSQNSEGETWTYSGNFENGTFNGQGTIASSDYEQSGTYTDGLFTPTKREFFANASYRCFAKYTLTENAVAYLDAHPEYFPATTQETLSSIKNAVDNSITYPMLRKSIANNSSALIHIDNITVGEIVELNFIGHTLTCVFLLNSDDNFYQLVYDGALPDVLNQDVISVDALPIAVSSFDNVSGGVTNVIVVAGAYVQKV
ncbi:hypothetical protein B5F17_06505 [Butyricicoccus pullicaecorum]|uniref:Uncharacterized protein n=1 Tax=Butyricicoccus pullicaecorum TaxID=501571 RepID=A0A1Y4L910_9FIRM|nr:hypothetical protein [Butyricicoccus pullicaecorum]OUP53218.1 hypothetical protein B5F17_06505 [Butyricicoccus pullicaecorum]